MSAKCRAFCSGCSLHRPVEPSGFAQMRQRFLAVEIDVFNDQFDNDNDGNREKHAGGIQDFSSQDNAENDGNGMKMQGFSDERRINEIMVDLCEHNIKSQSFQCHDGGLGRGENSTESGGNGRPQNGNELTDAGDHGKDRSVRQPSQCKIGRCR